MGNRDKDGDEDLDLDLTDIEDDEEDLEESGDEEESDADDDKSEDDEDSEEGDEDEESSDEPSGKKNRVSARDRIKQLVEAKKKAEREAFEADLRAIEAERRAAEREVAPAKTLKKPDPADFKYGEVDGDYLEAVVEYRVAVKAAERAKEDSAAATAAEQERLRKHYEAKYTTAVAAGKKKYKGFEELVQTTKYDPPLACLVLDSEYPVDIAYYLGNNVAELRKVTNMDPAERARFIGRLEGKFSAPSAVRKNTKAPEPLGSRRSTRRASESESKYGPDDQDEFDKAFAGR